MSEEIDYAARARALVPLIQGAAARMDLASELTSDVVDALHEAGLFRVLLPRAYRGGEIDLAVFMEIIETIAAADASVAWCLGQSGGCTLSAAYLDEKTARLIWSAPRNVMAWGPAAKDATAIRVDGGYILNGTTHFLSGVHHASWVGSRLCATNADGSACTGADGEPEGLREFLIPRNEVELERIWDVMGLRGTGSDCFTVKDLFVPAERTFLVDRASARRHPGKLYRFTANQVFAVGFACVGLGLARSALDALLDLAGRKRPTYWASTMRNSPLAQNQIALAEAKLRAARSYLFSSVREAWKTISSGASEPTREQKIDIRLAASHAGDVAKQTVYYAYGSAGATAIFNANPFERRFRDMHAVSQQVQYSAAQFTNVGQILLGLPPENPRTID